MDQRTVVPAATQQASAVSAARRQERCRRAALPARGANAGEGEPRNTHNSPTTAWGGALYSAVIPASGRCSGSHLVEPLHDRHITVT